MDPVKHRSLLNQRYDAYVIRTCKAWEQRLKEMAEEAPLGPSGLPLATPMQWEGFSKFLLGLIKSSLAGERAETVERWKDEEVRQEAIRTRILDGTVRCSGCDHALQLDDTEYEHLADAYLCYCLTCRRTAWVGLEGKEIVPEGMGCERCGAARRVSSAERRGSVLAIQTRCTGCGLFADSSLSLDPSPPASLPVAEPLHIDDWKKYCVTDPNAPSFESLMRDIRHFQKESDDTQRKEAEAAEQARWQFLSVAALQERLSTALPLAGFGSLRLQASEQHRYFIVPLEATDLQPTRTRDDAVTAFRRTLVSALDGTNWRLVKDSVEHRLGLLSARLRGFERLGEIRKDGEAGEE